MALPPSPRRRKVRLLRDEAADDAVLVVRATPADLDEAVASIAEDARQSAEVYVVDVPGGRELLYGVSVFAHPPGTDIAEVLDRFPGAPCYLETTAGRLRAAGFGVHPTGTNPDHYDVQLADGIRETDAQLGFEELLHAARRFAETAGSPLPSPSYAGQEHEEHE